jgi:hypothetical protein
VTDDIIILRCKNGHGQGIVQKDEKSKVNQLMMFRNSIDLAAEDPAEVQVKAVVNFGDVDITCDICGEIVDWSPNQAAYERLIYNYLHRAKIDLSKREVRERV